MDRTVDSHGSRSPHYDRETTTETGSRSSYSYSDYSDDDSRPTSVDAADASAALAADAAADAGDPTDPAAAAFHPTGLFYFLAHFSRFVRPGARRLGTRDGGRTPAAGPRGRPLPRVDHMKWWLGSV